MIESSTEEHTYVSSLSKERKCFEELIKLKADIVISLADDPHSVQEHKESNFRSDSRVKTAEPTTLGVVVDVREFRCALPSSLHSSGFQLIPRTLLV